VPLLLEEPLSPEEQATRGKIRIRADKKRGELKKCKKDTHHLYMKNT
jgi:hypothetical protein